MSETGLKGRGRRAGGGGYQARESELCVGLSERRCRGVGKSNKSDKMDEEECPVLVGG